MSIWTRFLLFSTGAAVVMAVAGCGAVPSVQPSPVGPSPTDPLPITEPNEWTWVSGSNVAGQAGVYGTLGVKAAANVPGARESGVTWTDAAGNLWLFGGRSAQVGGSCGQFDPLCTAGTNSWFNDLWKFDGTGWTWVSGSNSTDQPGVYGTKGVAAASNVPGSRYGAVSWSDTAGTMWLFGGSGYDSAGNVGLLNDIWKFSGGEWTWVGGSNTANPLGSFGTLGVAAPGNAPGGRSNAVGVADAAGNLWLFGGVGCDTTFCGGALSDLWKYSGGEWTWETGQSSVNPTLPGVYGTEGIAAQGNTPGGRYSTGGWIDPAGSVWVFGGAGWGDSTENLADLNDLWKYSGGEWAWVDGMNQTYPNVDLLGTYGTEGTASPSNIPGSRDSGMSWSDAKGNLWFFGGEGFGMSGCCSYNDLWKYSGGQWTWVSGSGVGDQTGMYGTIGVPAAANIPGARANGVTWTDAQGDLWLFGGVGVDSTGSGGFLNDLWEYQP